MDAPLALYRRYRPETFAEVIGQDHVTAPLRAALEANRVHHAYLFSGPRGCGKTTSARILARCLNCEQGPTSEPCGRCTSCRDLARGGPGSIDVIEIDAASHGGVDDARDLRERAFFAPVASRYKIYIIDEAHMVSPAGFNALLKLVEEPPEHIKFVFATTEPDKVIGTIRSRTHHYPFRLIPPRTLSDYLRVLCDQEGVRVDPAALPLVVRAGGGSARDTLSVLDQLIGGAGPQGVTYDLATGLLGFTPESLLEEVVDAFAASDGGAVFAVIDRVIETGQDPRRFTEDLLRRLRDLLIIAAVPDAPATGLVEAPPDLAERLVAQAARFGRADLSRAADLVAEGLTELKGATAPRLLLELICARVLLPGADHGTEGVMARLDRVEKRLSIGGSVSAEGGQASPGGPTRAGGRPPTSHATPASAQTSAAGAPSQPSATSAPSATSVVEQPPATPAPRPGQTPEPPSAPSPGGPVPPAAVTLPTRVDLPETADVTAGRAAEAAGGEPVQPEGVTPATTPARPVAGGLTLVDVRRLWPDILEAVKLKRRYTWILLSQNAQVAALDEATLTVALVNNGARQSFLSGGSEEILRQAAIDVVGHDWRVEAIVDPSAQPGSHTAGGAVTARPARGHRPAVASPDPGAPGPGAPDPGAPAPGAQGPGGQGPGGQTGAREPGGQQARAREPRGPDTDAGGGTAGGSAGAGTASGPPGSGKPAGDIPAGAGMASAVGGGAPQVTSDDAGDPEASHRARDAIQQTRGQGRRSAGTPHDGDADAHRDDPDAEDDLAGAELLAQRLGASVIEEIRHD